MSEQNKAVAVLIETFRDCLHRGKQPTFSAGDLKYFIEALLAPPADQQGEPVAFLTNGGNSFYFPSPNIEIREGDEPLYRHAQPATAKVMLPERLDLPHRDEFESADQHAAAVGEAKTWNACLDEVAKLNTPQ